VAEGPAENSKAALIERPSQAGAGARLQTELKSAPAVASKNNQQIPKLARTNLARLVTSFTVLLVLLLTMFYGAIWAFYPWRPLAELDVPGWIVDFADQVDLMMTERNPPVVILGSSLTLAAPRRLSRPNVYQEELSKRSGLKLTSICMAVPGAIASDQDFLLTQLLGHGKKPSLVIYTYAPRDFMDNTIEGKITSTPTRRVLNFINRRNSFLPHNLSTAAFKECFDNHAAFLDLVRRHVLRSVRAYVCKVSGHPDTLWSASMQARAGASAPVGGKESSPEGDFKAAGAQTTGGGSERADETAAVKAGALKKDLELYNRRYNPQNKGRIDEQYKHVEELLRLGQAHGIKVALVGMPISPANMSLLKTGVYEAMDQRLQGLATKYGADIFDLNLNPQVKFEQDEYLDSVHLSTGGAAHFVPLFVDTVVESRAFKAAFSAKAPSP
jgi:hypothetical protein